MFEKLEFLIDTYSLIPRNLRIQAISLSGAAHNVYLSRTYQYSYVFSENIGCSLSSSTANADGSAFCRHVSYMQSRRDERAVQIVVVSSQTGYDSPFSGWLKRVLKES